MQTLRVLIVEDEFIIAMDLQGRIGTMGCEVVAHVASGEAAVRAAQALRPDLIFMDVRLKGALDGVAAAERIVAAQNIAVVFLSGQADPLTREASDSVRHAAFLTKPFVDAELLAAIEKVRATLGRRIE